MNPPVLVAPQTGVRFGLLRILEALGSNKLVENFAAKAAS